MSNRVAHVGTAAQVEPLEDHTVGATLCTTYASTLHTDKAKAVTRIAVPIPLSASARAAADLQYRISAETSGGSLYGSIFESIFRTLPQMMESSSALTAAAQCCMSTDSVIRLAPYHSKGVDQVLYRKTLKALQSALQDPHQRLSKTTLSAIVVLRRVEVHYLQYKIQRSRSLICWAVPSRHG